MRKSKHKWVTAILSVVSILCFYACTNDTSSSSAQGVDSSQSFNAEFTGTYRYVGLDTLANPLCQDTMPYRVMLEAEGREPLLGDVKVVLDFCTNQDGFFGMGTARLVDESNDTLIFAATGRLIQGKQESHPDFVISYWQDEFEVIGGTGKYKGASGSITTDDYNSSQDPNSHHSWRGVIRLGR